MCHGAPYQVRAFTNKLVDGMPMRIVLASLIFVSTFPPSEISGIVEKLAFEGLYVIYIYILECFILMRISHLHAVPHHHLI